MTYSRFAAMIATSTVVMFILMYLNTYSWEHVAYSETRVYMAIVMGASMAIIMLGYMAGMYESTKINIGIFIGSAIVFALALWLVRSQATVSQVSYMRAMIPHHSIAIMTSERAQITDPRVRKLADEIIEAQRKEIAEMRYLIAQLAGDEDAVRPEIYEGEPAEVGTISEALQGALVETLDPSPLNEAEAAAVLPPGRGCEFSRTAQSDPILVVRAPAGATATAAGVMKLNGKLVRLSSTSSAGFEALLTGTTMIADGVCMSVAPVADDEPGIVHAVGVKLTSQYTSNSTRCVTNRFAWGPAHQVGITME
jgi:hypothetical protein